MADEEIIPAAPVEGEVEKDAEVTAPAHTEGEAAPVDPTVAA